MYQGLLDVAIDHRDTNPHYPWEFSLSDLSIEFDNDRIIVTAPNSDEIGLKYQFIWKRSKEEFLAWFSQYHSDKYRFIRNFKELRG
jgi:hypothetical protein